MIKAAVDRIEGDWLVIVPESGPVFQLPISLFPGLNEGDVVMISVEKDESAKGEIQVEIDEIRKELNRVEL